MKEFHELANLFPLMEGEEFDQLCEDIRANGQLEPIWLHPNGSIVDGRNRYRACLMVGAEPKYRTWSGGGSLVSFIVSLNLHRRHLTASQRAAIAVDILPALEAENPQGNRSDLTGGNIATSITGKNRDAAAEMMGVGARYVQDAKRLSLDAPDLLEQVRIGAATIPQAKRELVKRERRDAPPLPTDKYRVIYADPPWSYGNSGIIGGDNYGHVGRHYPSMTIAELCDMGEKVREITERDAVLFMWVTSPLLAECFDVVRAWGFQYKTSFVWDKVKHNFGHYNSVRHEFLLVCTRGSCVPDVDDKIDSVQTIERSRVHSEKPQEFRHIIDRLYTSGKRVELFARAEADGWDAWGNE